MVDEAIDKTLKKITECQEKQLKILKAHTPVIKALNHNSTKTAQAIESIDRSLEILSKTQKLSEENNKMLLKSNIGWTNVFKTVSLTLLAITLGFIFLVTGTKGFLLIMKFFGF